MSDQHYNPPQLSARLLGWLLRDEWGTPAGDYEEYFNELAETRGPAHARWWYRRQVMRLLPDRIYEKLYWSRAMLKNYFTLGFRNLIKNKTVSLINILGLTGAVGCTIAVYLFLQAINAADEFHKNADQVYLIGHTVQGLDELEQWGTSPLPMGPLLESTYAQVTAAARFSRRGAMVQGTASSFQEAIAFADPAFLDILTFPLQLGNSVALSDPNAVIISDETAKKYFRDANPMNEEVIITFDNGAVVPLTIRGVAAPYPSKPSLSFDFLVNIQNLERAGVSSLTDWAQFTDATLLQIPDKNSIPSITAALNQYTGPQNQANADWQIQSYFLDNIGKPDWSAWKITRRAMRAPDPWAMLVMGMIALLTLMVASFNYINISIGMADRRLKEIGVRKTAGAEKKQLVAQLMTENIVLCLFALVLGLLLAWLFIIPQFNELFVEKIPLDFAGNLKFWGFLFGLLVFLGFLSGIYPALYISSFQPIAILRGRLKMANKKRLTHAFLTIQFALSLLTICICMGIFSLKGFFEERPWGYNAEQTIVIPIINQEQFLTLHDTALQLPHVKAVSGADAHIGASRNPELVQVEGEDQRALVFGVGPDYLSSMSIAVSSGSDFVGTGKGSEVIINKAFVEARSWLDPIGEIINYEETPYTVVGVIDDFLVDPMLGRTAPAFLHIVDNQSFQYVTVQTAAGRSVETAEILQRTWDQAFPEVPYEYFVQVDVFEDFFNSLRRVIRNIGYLAFFSLLVSCMGLFGMASQKAAQRIKEVGVRKVMGANATNIVLLVNKGFLIILVLVSLVITPVCYFGFSFLLNLAPTAIPLAFWPFLAANGIILSMAALSMASQMSRLIRITPAEILRHP